MSLRLARQIADTVLYEGYVLYPYRASSTKNNFRWQVGLLLPREYAEASGSDPWAMQTECLAEVAGPADVAICVRCLQVQDRSVEQRVADERWEPVHSLWIGDRQLITWQEGVVAEFTKSARLDGPRGDTTFQWELPPHDSIEIVRDAAGEAAARLIRQTQPVSCTIRLAWTRSEALLKLHLRVENHTASTSRSLADRDAAIRQGMAGTHAVLSITGGQFISLLDPPAYAAEAAAACINHHTWPVLIGAPASSPVMLSSPVILYDNPAIAPESAGDLCDATEIDELLMLRVRTLTPDEKREACATDPRAARIIEQADTATAEGLSRMHGAVRVPAAGLDTWETFLNPPDAPAPEAASVEAGGTRFAAGSRVRLNPHRAADSMDICLRGRLATVSAVHRTLEDTPYVSVILDDDPFGAEGERFRRAFFFHPDELVPFDPETVTPA